MVFCLTREVNMMDIVIIRSSVLLLSGGEVLLLRFALMVFISFVFLNGVLFLLLKLYHVQLMLLILLRNSVFRMIYGIRGEHERGTWLRFSLPLILGCVNFVLLLLLQRLRVVISFTILQ